MTKTTIEWTDVVWNPTTGCSKISPGCQHCYAERMTHRLQAHLPKYRNGFEPTFHSEQLAIPAQIKGSKRIFVNSMSDLFHEALSLREIRQVFDAIVENPQHTFQILTKRPWRAYDLKLQLPWPSNLWLGISVESDAYQTRIDYLREIPAQVRFISFEPLLGPISRISLQGIHWATVGGETGPGARPMRPEWVKDIHGKCVRAGVPFFFKSWGGVGMAKGPALLDGREWKEFPAP
jgi:protein gp37